MNRMARAFNEWMRRFIEQPERFEREFRSVTEFMRETEAGKEPTYGETCAAYLEEILAELDKGEASVAPPAAPAPAPAPAAM